jgi:hypothetical protein
MINYYLQELINTLLLLLQLLLLENIKEGIILREE